MLERFASRQDVDVIVGMVVGGIVGAVAGGLLGAALGATKWGDAALGAMAGGFFIALIGAVVGLKVGSQLVQALRRVLGDRLAQAVRVTLFVTGSAALALVGYFWGRHILETLHRVLGSGN